VTGCPHGPGLRRPCGLPAGKTGVKNPGMKFSIITPSFRNSNWLKLCIASV